MNQKTFPQIIKESFLTLSPGQKKVAEFLLHHMNEGALLTAFQIGQQVGVSETTVIRLAYALGFSGYSGMQEMVRKDWLANQHSVSDEGNYPRKEDRDEEHLFSDVIDQERLILQQLLNQLSPDEIWKAVDELVKADRVYIGGLGSSYAAAYWFYYTLKQLRENVFLSSPTGFLLEDICELTEKSAVVIFSFPRYRRETHKLANFAKKQKAIIVAITNRQLSPIGQLADITLTTEEQMESGHHSIASVVSLLEVIIAGIHIRDRERISIRQQKLELLYTDQELFLE
ncbi:MurR/RpiR family transcriptional regulator [Metabacillus herbersteinensis]|uniref:MurR/RpiR family transcriptional regulator n=1 Tax=Metabacillus herbersteinensis TaxID=283816 RepID=A0ABV6GG87_9BACI